MTYEKLLETYTNAQKSARQSFTRHTSRGGSGYLPSLDGLVKNADVISEIDIGNYEIPLKKIVGTASHSRATSFAPNFMPLQKPNSEFARKWISLYEAHTTEGIRDSITLFEYYNWFYVREGNKRTSVLKFAEAYSINAEVRRILPKRDPSNITNTIYYEFLEFNRITHIFTIWFSQPGRFTQLLEYLENYNPDHVFSINKYEHFYINVYTPFAALFHEIGGDKLSITTADALLKFISLYGIPQELNPAEYSERIRKLLPEFESFNNESSINLITQPIKESSQGMLNTIAKAVTNKKLRVGFIYAKKPTTSGWTNAHNQGRQHIISLLGNQVETFAVEDVPQNEEAYSHITALADKEMDIIFTTSPTFHTATLKAAIDYPKIKFFNCSENDSSKNVRTYFGRTHEVRFLMGLIAGSMSNTGNIGYVATYPISEVISGINAFAIGVSMMNPRARINVKWMYRWENDPLSYKAADELTKEGADLICQDDLPIIKQNRKAYGLFSTMCDLETGTCTPHKHFAIPMWHWGVFYEKIISNIINDTWKLFFEGGKTDTKPVSFWWGINSGLVDIFYSTTLLPRNTQKHVEFFRRMIMQNEFSIFEGPLFDQLGKVKVPEGERANHDQIVTMDWFVDNVRGSIPEIEKKDIHDPLTKQYKVT